MNKNFYRIVFSQVRGMFIAVAETVKSRTKQAGQGGTTHCVFTQAEAAIQYKKLNLLHFSVIGWLGAVVISVPMQVVADTQIIADRTAPNSQQPTILNSANGVTQVNIQTPSAGGVSRNTYSQFDVGTEGAILNNARNNVQSQIGGWVQGNPWLAKGEASVILNEVNSSNPSQLKGYIEVAGKQAQVVIANPSGLICDGCGVINADRFTLTTGQAVMSEGYLESFRVREGQITIQGKGLNGSLTPYTDIYSRALEVNAGLYANQLTTILGENDILVKDHEQATHTAIQNNNSSQATQFALDVGQLGGMYAQKIYLIGTEQGVGVRNAGTINSSTSSLVLNTNGDLVNQGNIVASQDQIDIQAQHIQNSGNISSSQHQITLQATDIQNNGLIASSDEVKLSAQGNINNNEGVINAGRLDITAQNLSNDQGHIEQIGGQQLHITATTLDNTQGLIGQVTTENSGSETQGNTGQTSAPVINDPQENSSAQDTSSVAVVDSSILPIKTFADGVIRIADGIQSQSGVIANNNDISLQVSDSIINAQGEIQLPELQFDGQLLDNQGGKLYSNVVDIAAQTLNNQSGQLYASQGLNVVADQVNNALGSLQSGTTLTIKSGDLNNQQGQLIAEQNVEIKAKHIDNNAGVIASSQQDVSINSDVLENIAGRISAKNIDLQGQQLNNQQGSIYATDADLSIDVQQINNGTTADQGGQLIAAKQLDMNSQTLNSTGQVYAGDTLSLYSNRLIQDGQLAAYNKVLVQADQIQSNENGQWIAGLDQEGNLSNTASQLDIQAEQAQLAGQILAGSSIKIAADQVDLSQSAAQAQDIQVQSTQLATVNAKIIADSTLNLQATETIDNSSGQYSATQVNLSTAYLNNDQGLIQHTGKDDFVLDIVTGIDNNAGQIISNATNTDIKTASLTNTQGEILHAGEHQLSIDAQSLQGQAGKIQSNGDLQLNIGVANLDDAITTAQNIKLTAIDLSHEQGQLVQSDGNGKLDIQVKQGLNNQSGLISAAGDASIYSQDLNNQQGLIQTDSGHQLDISSQAINNTDAKIIAGGNSNIETASLNNRSGIIYADGQIGIVADQLADSFVNNQNGLIAAKDQLDIRTQNLNNQSGQLQSEQADINLDIGQELNNQQGIIQAAQALNLQAGTIVNQNGQLISGTDTQLSVVELNNQSGTIYSNQQLDVTVSGMADNQTGIIAAEQAMNLNAQNLINNAGQIRSEHADLNIQVAQNIENNAGLIAAAKNLNLTAQHVRSQNAKIQSGAATDIQVDTLDNQNGLLYATTQLQLAATGELNNHAGVIAAEQLTDIQADAINNDEGQILSQQDQLTLNVKNNLSNQSGEISAGKAIQFDAKTISNQQGKVIAGESLKVNAEALNNSQGTIYAQNQLGLDIATALNNQAGTIAAQQAMAIKAQSLNNERGIVRAEQDQLTLAVAQTLDNQSGEIYSAKNTAINANHIENQSGQVVSGASLNIQSGGLNNTQGTLYANDQLAIKNTTVIDNTQGLIAADQAVDIQAGAMNNNVGQIRSQQDRLDLNIQQDIDNTSGLISAATGLDIAAQQLISNQGQILSGGAAKLAVSTLDNADGTLYATGALEIAATAEIDNTKGVIAADDAVEIAAQSLNNNAGQLHSQQAGINLQLQQKLDNQSGEIYAAKAVDIIADQLTNQTAKIIAGESLAVKANALNNNEGTLYAQNQVSLDIAAALNNQNGAIAAQQAMAIKAQSLNNDHGMIRAEQDQLTLAVSQTLNNQSGEIYGAKNTSIGANYIDNQQGLILTGDAMQLTANGLNNQQGTIHSSTAAILDITGQLDNQAGLIAAEQDLSLSGQDIFNTEGQLSSQQGNLSIQVQGSFDNQRGDVYAQGDIDLNAQGVNNQSGQIAAQHAVQLDSGLQQLNNQQGRIIAGSIDLKTGEINNQSGLIQGEQSVRIDSRQHDLINRDSGQDVGILSGGTLQLEHIATLDNRQGFIAATDTGEIHAQQLDNRSGQIIGQSDLTFVQTASNGQLDNQGGQISAQKNIQLNYDQLNNNGIGSHIAAGETLTIDVQQLNNQQNKNDTVLGGLDGQNISITAQDLNNLQGAIRAEQIATLNVRQNLNNQQGSISSLDRLSIGGADKTLNIDNTGGEILAQNQLDISANQLINQGKIISLGDADIALKQSYHHGDADQILVNGTLKLGSEGDIINSASLSAGEKIELNAKNIQNQTGASISSNETHLTATDTVHNQGLINGELTHIVADRVWNDGARIYGTHVAIQANTLDNQSGALATSSCELAEQCSADQLSGAVIASRGDMDLGVGTLNNRSGGEVKATPRDNAWIFSSGDLRIGGSLDANDQAQGWANTLNNDSARIESLGDMTLVAHTINNTNQNFSTDIAQVGEVEKLTYIQPKGSASLIPVENLYWQNWSRAGLYRYKINPDVLPENVVLGETPIPYLESVDCIGEGEDSQCSVNYHKDDAVWAYFGITPPTVDAPTAPTLEIPVTPTGQSSCEAGAGYDETACIAYQQAYAQYQADQDAYNQAWQDYQQALTGWEGSDEAIYILLDEAIENYNAQFSNDQIKSWTQYKVQQTEYESYVVTSTPGEIIAGGDLNIVADLFNNDNSQVLAGGVLKAEVAKFAAQADNGVHIVHQTGTSQYTYSKWRGGFKRYHQRKYDDSKPYDPEDVVTGIMLPVAQWLGNIKNHTLTQDIAAVEVESASNITPDVQLPGQSGDQRQQEIDQDNIDVTGGQQISADAGQLKQADVTEIATVDAGQNIKTDAVHIQRPDAVDALEIGSGQQADVDGNTQQTASIDAAQQLQNNPNALSAVETAQDYEVRSVTLDTLTLPSNALFITTGNSQAQYLVETDPAFINYKQWLSSDYMIKALSLDPALMQKRIGDGYYEQRLVQDQVAALTGYRFLSGYSSDEEQYMALMNNAVTFAKQYDLRPGIALTAQQIAQLTSDIVWLEEKTVVLADGSTTTALVPQVYVKARAGDLKGDGSLISADQVRLQVTGDVLNSATIAGRQAIELTADNVNQLGGRMQTNQLTVQTTGDFNNIGGTIVAKDTAAFDIGGDFKHESSSYSSSTQLGSSEFSRTGIDRVAGLYVGSELNQINSDTDNLKTTLSIRVGGNSSIKAAEIVNANGSSVIQSAGDLEIGSIQVREMNSGVANVKNYNKQEKREDIGSSISGLGDVVLSANNITGKAVNLNSTQGDVALLAENDITLENGEKYFAMDQASYIKSKGSLGSNSMTTKIKGVSDQSIANQIEAGGNVVLRSEQGNIDATHLVASAGNNIQIVAEQGDVNLRSAIDTEMRSVDTASKGTIKYSNRQQGYIDEEVAQSTLKAGNTVDINAGKNIELQANDIQAGNSIYVGNTLMQRQADGTLASADGSTMPENVTLSTLATTDEQWNEHQSGYRGIAKELVKVVAIGATGLGISDKIKIGESSSERLESTSQQHTALTADNIAIGSSGQTTLTSAELSAKNVIVSGEKVTLNAAEESSKHTLAQGEETVQGLGAKLNKDSIRLGGFVLEDKTDSTTTTVTTHKAGSINTENLSIQGAEGIDILGQNIKATGDTLLDHGRGDLNIGGYENSTVVENNSHVETISTEVGVRNAYVDAALAVQAVAKAGEAVKQAKDQYSQAEKDYQSGKITKQALEDSKANVVMATANLANAQIAVGAAAAAAATAAATSYGTGFTIGANGERVETDSTTTSSTGQWQGSNLELNNLTLKSEGQDVNIQGSRLSATGTTYFDGTKDLNVTAGTEHGSERSDSKTNSQSVSYTYGGGASASLGKQSSTAQSDSLSYVNSEVTLNRTEGSIDSLNIQGGNVSIADRGDLQVNNIHVESLQDTASSSNSSKGGSIGGGTSGNVSAGYNQSKGESDSAWVNNQSSLLIGNDTNDADLDAMGVKNISNIGGIIANATRNEDGSLTDHQNLNYTGNLELKDIEDHNYSSGSGFNVSTSIGIPQGGTKAASTAPQGSTTIGLNSSGQETEQLTKATMGQGTVKNVTDSTNRDINNTQEITRDQTTGMLDGSITVDHRLLSESGRTEIVQEQKDIGKNLHTSINAMRDGVEELAKKLPENMRQPVLDGLNQLELKLNQLPAQDYAGGELIANTYETLILAGVDRKELLDSLDNEQGGLIKVAGTLAQIEGITAELISQGYTAEDILLYRQQYEKGSAQVISIQGENEVLLGGSATLGIELFQAINKFHQEIQYLVDSSGVDPQTVSLVIGAMVSGPIKLAGSVATSVLSDTLFGEYIETAKDNISTTLAAKVHLLSEENAIAYLDQTNRAVLDNEALTYAEWLSNSKDGARVLIDVAAESVGVGSGIVVGGIVKGKSGDSDVTVSQAGGIDLGGNGSSTTQSNNTSTKVKNREVVEVNTSSAIKGTREYEILNNPPANSHIKLDNGTEFKTNEHGYVEEVIFQPSLIKNSRDARQTAVGKLGDDGDVGGHIQACSLGGTCDNFNLFPQNSNFNNSAYKKWENEIRSSLKGGDKVGQVKVKFDRSNSSNIRPESLVVEYNINGKVKTREFLNEASK